MYINLCLFESLLARWHKPYVWCGFFFFWLVLFQPSDACIVISWTLRGRPGLRRPGCTTSAANWRCRPTRPMCLTLSLPTTTTSLFQVMMTLWTVLSTKSIRADIIEAKNLLPCSCLLIIRESQSCWWFYWDRPPGAEDASGRGAQLCFRRPNDAGVKRAALWEIWRRGGSVCHGGGIKCWSRYFNKQVGLELFIVFLLLVFKLLVNSFSWNNTINRWFFSACSTIMSFHMQIAVS